jgi:hypothetical protein
MIGACAESAAEQTSSKIEKARIGSEATPEGQARQTA